MNKLTKEITVYFNIGFDIVIDDDDIVDKSDIKDYAYDEALVAVDEMSRDEFVKSFYSSGEATYYTTNEGEEIL